MSEQNEPVLTEAALADLLAQHAYVPSGLRGVSRCACGEQFHGMPHDHRAHVARILAARLAAQPVPAADYCGVEFGEAREGECECSRCQPVPAPTPLSGDESYPGHPCPEHGDRCSGPTCCCRDKHQPVPAPITAGGNPTCPECGNWYGPGEKHICPAPSRTEAEIKAEALMEAADEWRGYLGPIHRTTVSAGLIARADRILRDVQPYRCRVCGANVTSGADPAHDGAAHDARVADMPVPAPSGTDRSAVAIAAAAWEEALRWVRQQAEVTSPEYVLDRIDRAEPFNPYRTQPTKDGS